GPIGIGALFTLVGMVVVGPVIAKPVSRFIGSVAPRLKGMTGSLARDNATRNPRRTAGTAAALMVGIAVVTFFVTVFASLKATTANQIDRSFVGDFAVNSGNFGRGGFSPKLERDLAKV